MNVGQKCQTDLLAFASAMVREESAGDNWPSLFSEFRVITVVTIVFVSFSHYPTLG